MANQFEGHGISEVEVVNVDKNRIKVSILGETFTLKGSMPLPYIRKIAEYVDSKMQAVKEQNPKLSPQKVAILASLNLADEIFKLREEIKEMEDLFNEKDSP